MDYIDSNNKTINDTLQTLLTECNTLEEKLEAIFNFVKNDIKFAFLPEADLIPAPEIIKRGAGQCNNKSILFHALCKAAGIPSRIHFSTITKQIHHGLFKGLLFLLAPSEISHSWIEVLYRDEWISIDSFINDEEFYQRGKDMLKRKGLTTGFSVSCADGNTSSAFSLKGDGFVQMAAVSEDHGVYDNPHEYFTSGKHKNSVGFLKRLIYRLHVPGLNKRIENIRLGRY